MYCARLNRTAHGQWMWGKRMNRAKKCRVFFSSSDSTQQKYTNRPTKTTKKNMNCVVLIAVRVYNGVENCMCYTKKKHARKALTIWTCSLHSFVQISIYYWNGRITFMKWSKEINTYRDVYSSSSIRFYAVLLLSFVLPRLFCREMRMSDLKAYVLVILVALENISISVD